jgi:alpha-glucosidase (family GH31 glycosyl hydrolase)
MFKTDDNQFAGVYFVGSAPAQFEIVRYEGYDWTIVNYIAIAGTIEAYFILPNSAEEVIKTYQNMVGLPAFPPMSALGFY